MLTEPGPWLRSQVRPDLLEAGLVCFRYDEPDHVDPDAQQEVVRALFEQSVTGPVAFVVESGPEVKLVGPKVLSYWLSLMRMRTAKLTLLAVVAPHGAIRVFFSTFAQAVRGVRGDLEVKSFPSREAALAWVRPALAAQRGAPVVPRGAAPSGIL
jgi:hypothetical protein